MYHLATMAISILFPRFQTTIFWLVSNHRHITENYTNITTRGALTFFFSPECGFLHKNCPILLKSTMATLYSLKRISRPVATVYVENPRAPLTPFTPVSINALTRGLSLLTQGLEIPAVSHNATPHKRIHNWNGVYSWDYNTVWCLWLRKVATGNVCNKQIWCISYFPRPVRFNVPFLLNSALISATSAQYSHFSFLQLSSVLKRYLCSYAPACCSVCIAFLMAAVLLKCLPIFCEKQLCCFHCHHC